MSALPLAATRNLRDACPVAVLREGVPKSLAQVCTVVLETTTSAFPKSKQTTTAFTPLNIRYILTRALSPDKSGGGAFVSG